jgi:hypothetical protein
VQLLPWLDIRAEVVLRLTLLAPDIVEVILGGRQPTDLELEDLLRRFPVGGRTANRHVEFGWIPACQVSSSFS